MGWIFNFRNEAYSGRVGTTIILLLLKNFCMAFKKSFSNIPTCCDDNGVKPSGPLIMPFGFEDKAFYIWSSALPR